MIKPCIRCDKAETHEGSVDGQPGGQLVYGIVCDCGRGTFGFDSQSVVDRWNDSLSGDLNKAIEAAYWKRYNEDLVKAPNGRRPPGHDDPK